VDAGRLGVFAHPVKKHGFPHTAQADKHGAFGRAPDTGPLERYPESGA
jgi:hypothetical protein